MTFLVEAEIEAALEEVPGASGPKGGEERGGDLALRHVAETGQHALVVQLRLKPHPGLQHVGRGDGTMYDGKAGCAGKSKPDVEVQAGWSQPAIPGRSSHKDPRELRAVFELEARCPAETENHGLNNLGKGTIRVPSQCGRANSSVRFRKNRLHSFRHGEGEVTVLKLQEIGWRE